MKTVAVNLYKEHHDVYIGRPRSGDAWTFGNPFVVGKHGVQGECVQLFERWLAGEDMLAISPDATDARRKWMLEHLHLLKDKRLGCFCKPRACHGDVLAALANAL
jgi:hypothetical protein